MNRDCRLFVILVLVTALSGPALADTDSSLSQVYEAARTGQLKQAQQMMDQVLHDHPDSAEAHYVRAELDAAQGDLPSGRRELNVAQDLDPSLQFARPESVVELRRRLGQAQSVAPSGQLHIGPSWSRTVLLLVIGVSLFWALFRRPSAQSDGDLRASEFTAPPDGRPVFAGGASASTSGVSLSAGVVGGLASGMAAGAGVVAGEELARHFLGSEREASTQTGHREESDVLDGPGFGISGGSSSEEGQTLGGNAGDDDWT